ncbi:uncharacterized protein LOC134678341 [Cydia fagiglandana]|uniref:uncharacterized protein LOC134678341 n=1 Tax=Cydia fagiglandana TaxID=1458189 RepID=UPI002FEE1683
MACSELRFSYRPGSVSRTLTDSAFRQLLFRAFLLIAVCIVAVTIKPRMRDIPHGKLLCDYKHPRRVSTFSIWIMALLTIFEPLAIFWLLSKDFGDTVEVFQMWSLSISITAAITEFLKLTVGRPRPDFYYRCFPDGVYKTNMQCTGKLRDIIDGRKSFPSGHTGLAFASLGMVSLFMYERSIVLYEEQSRASQLLFYSMPLMVASAIGVSRCIDNQHHWEDVLVGAIIGFSTSCFCYCSDCSWCDVGVSYDLL